MNGWIGYKKTNQFTKSERNGTKPNLKLKSTQDTGQMESNRSNPLVDDYMLKPGYIFLPQYLRAISTVLGSSISVCLYNRKTGRCGMNHFFFPPKGKSQKPTAKYENVFNASNFKIAVLRVERFRGSYWEPL